MFDRIREWLTPRNGSYARRARREYGLDPTHPMWNHGHQLPLGLPPVIVTEFLPGFIARSERYRYDVLGEFTAAVRGVSLSPEVSLALIGVLARDRRSIDSVQDLYVLRKELLQLANLAAGPGPTAFLAAPDMRIALFAAENNVPIEYALAIGTNPSGAATL